MIRFGGQDSGNVVMIKVLFFGPVAERVGTSEAQLPFRAGMRLQDVRAQLQQLHPAAFEIVCFAAVNGEHALDMSLPLVDHSEVVFMSKFSGG
jgi:molybdopterin converting factor small subunit